jgi:hypothetical protein
MLLSVVCATTHRTHRHIITHPAGRYRLHSHQNKEYVQFTMDHRSYHMDSSSIVTYFAQ